jgi:hypothetical protein
MPSDADGLELFQEFYTDCETVLCQIEQTAQNINKINVFNGAIPLRAFADVTYNDNILTQTVS